MKKNRMLRLASVLVICVLLTASVIGGTFAKYITKAEFSDSARVAKWGVTVTTSGDGAFAGEYATNGTVNNASGNAITNSVKASVDVVAPGTEGNLANAAISGTPEVAVNVGYTAELTLTGWTVDSTEYFPIVITVNSVKYKMGATASESDTEKVFTSIDALKTAVVTAIGNFSQNYDVNTDLSTITGNNVAVSWEWPFAGGDDSAYQTNAKDTALGDLIADANNNNDPTILLKITTTVTQID